MITPEETRVLCLKIKDGERIRGTNIHRIILPCGVALRGYSTQETDMKARAAIIQNEEQTWTLVVRGWNYNYQTMTQYWAGDLLIEHVENMTHELRGDEAQFLQDMTMCRMFDELTPNEDVRMAS